ncbi:FAD-dependent oxidoreductase [Sutterella sp.]|uniref:FAD-dependent oxidoreductase n=1 Tax=Sutterella sp. TaxID=1981025 RepID=UPI0026E0FE3D|nr:FAD-dependent oxidoreductase [Sutterella sp.]MDO5532953.1 FAD-dependent oxidoreductase [Sutterella sp.]
MNRRDLLKTGLLGAGAAAVAAPAHAKAPPAKRPSEEWDVVVVGAGFAGMCAALEAAEQGARVVLLEKMGRPDGATVYSSGWIAAVGSRFQKNHPEDSKQAFFDDMMRLSHYRSDPDLIRVYAEEAGDGIDWLADHGTPFFLWENLPSPELSRCLISPGEGITGGSKLIRCLMAALEKKNVPIHYNAKAVELIADDCYNVEGVSCITPEGRRDYLAKGGVILTTGGYGANPAMVTQYIGPWASRLIVRGSPWITGENIIMANQVMAKLVNMDQFYAGPITPTGHANPSPLMHAGYGIQVNSEGRRFVPETWLQVPKAKAIAERTPDNMSYMLIGKDADNNANILSNTIKRFGRLGFKVFEGETIEAVAKAAGVPEKNLRETVEEFNKAVKAGKAAELDPPYEYETPHALETGPYYMIPAAGGMASTFGGPKIDPDARVVNYENRPIPGLYAAGAAAGGVWYADDIGGNQLGGGLVFGRVAARHAAKRAKARQDKKA